MNPQHGEADGRDLRPGGESAPVVELVDHVPAADRLGDLWYEEAEVALEVAPVVWPGESAQPVEPERVGEVVQGDEHADTAGGEPVEQVEVVVKRGLVPASLFRLDPAPLDGHAVGPVAERGQQVHVLAVAAVVVTGPARGLAHPALAVRPGTIRLLLAVPGLAVDVVALDLVAGGGAAPEEPLGEADGRQAEHIVHAGSPEEPGGPGSQSAPHRQYL